MSLWRRVFGGAGDPSAGPGAASSGPGVRSMRFDTAGWKEKRASNDAVEWSNDDGDVLRAQLFARPAPFLANPPDLAALREHFRRESAAAKGAIVSVEPASIQGIPCVEVIKKFERRPAYAFEGVLVIGFATSHFVVTVESIERGRTGVRDAVVTGHLMESGELEIEIGDEPGPDGAPIKGWFVDPYLEGYQGPVLHSLSDDERIDVLFPDHPLSKVRGTLARIAKTLRFDPSIHPGKPAQSGAASTAAQGVERKPTDRARRPMTSVAVGTLFARAGRAKKGMAILEEVVKEAESAPGVPGTELAHVTGELGRLHLIQGDAGKAKELLRRAADLREQLGGGRDLAAALMYLGLACERLDDFGAAEAALRKALAAVGPFEPGDPLRGEVTVNLGRICISQHKADEAEPIFKEALRMFEAEDPPRRSNAAIALNGLGLVHNQREQYSAAIPLFEKALAIFEEVHGPDFPDVGTVLRNMAFSWHQLGNEEKVAELAQRAARVGRPRP